MRTRAFVLGLCFIMPTVCAEDFPSLDESIAKALAHSPEVAMAQARVAYAETQLRGAQHDWFHPDVRVFAGDNAITGATRAGIQLGQDLMRFLTGNREAVQKADYELTIARQALAVTQQRVIYQVCETRAQLERMNDLLALRMRAVDEHATRLALANTAFNAATGTWEQVLSAQHALAQAYHELRQTQRELHLARITFAQLLGESLPAEEMLP